MADMVLVSLQYLIYLLIYLLEGGVLVCLLFRRHGRRLAGVTSYLALLLVADGFTRTYALYHYGFGSRQYGYIYWLTDLLLAFAAFLVVCAFFRRACTQEREIWRYLPWFLFFVFILVLGISCSSLLRNYQHLFTVFIVEFAQNLYFTCLVLNTLLYIMMQQIETADDELGLLVCGMGIQFAGPAASLALLHLTIGAHYTKVLAQLIMPLCTLGMLLTWLYAVVRMPTAAGVPEGDVKKPQTLAAQKQAMVTGKA